MRHTKEICCSSEVKHDLYAPKCAEHSQYIFYVEKKSLNGCRGKYCANMIQYLVQKTEPKTFHCGRFFMACILGKLLPVLQMPKSSTA